MARLQNGCLGDRFVCLYQRSGLISQQPPKSCESLFMDSNLSVPPLIEMRDVVKVYATAAGEFSALRGINMRVKAGEFVGIVGKSGAGKSTLLNMITGVDDVTSGEVTINTNGSSVSIHELSEDQVAFWRGKTLGVVFQSFQLLPMLTLVENITLPMDLCGVYSPRESRERALELLLVKTLVDRCKINGDVWMSFLHHCNSFWRRDQPHEFDLLNAPALQNIRGRSS